MARCGETGMNRVETNFHGGGKPTQTERAVRAARGEVLSKRDISMISSNLCRSFILIFLYLRETGCLEYSYSRMLGEIADL